MNCICCGTSFEAQGSVCPRCGWNPNALHTKTAGYAVGDIVHGRYKIGNHLGTGTFGVAIKAQDLEAGRPVVLRVIHPALLPDDDAKLRFIAGMKRRTALEHPHLATVYDAGEDGDNCYYVRELLIGVSLDQLLADQKIVGQVFPVDEAVHIIERLSSALTVRSGIVHGLFSPSKIWVLAKGMKVVDYGVAMHLPPAAVWYLQKGGDAGRYVAPELMDNRPPEPGADVYALGVLLGEMLSLVEYDGRVQCFREAEPDFSREIEALIRCALSADPDARYSDAMEFVSALYDVTGRDRTSVMPPDETAVMPMAFLSQLRSFSDVPPHSDEEDKEGATEIIEDEEGATEIIEDEEGATEVIGHEVLKDVTRRVHVDNLRPDEDGGNEELSTPSVPPPLGKPSVPPLRKPSVPSLRKPSVPPPRRELRPVGFRPTDLGPLARATKAKGEPPPPPVSSPRYVSVPSPIPKSSTPPDQQERSWERDVGDAVDSFTPDSSKTVSPKEEAPPSDKIDRLAGINPRFLRAAAKLEAARTSRVDAVGDAGDTELNDEDWRRRLQDSSDESMVSFLANDIADDGETATESAVSFLSDEIEGDGTPETVELRKKPLTDRAKRALLSRNRTNPTPPPLPPKRK